MSHLSAGGTGATAAARAVVLEPVTPSTQINLATLFHKAAAQDVRCVERVQFDLAGYLSYGQIHLAVTFYLYTLTLTLTFPL